VQALFNLLDIAHISGLWVNFRLLGLAIEFTFEQQREDENPDYEVW
jgi:hypothetical protein